jgi:hypothetical protein
MRLAKDLQCLRVNSYAHAAKTIDAIGRLAGGWIKRHEALERLGYLRERLIALENLLAAAEKACKGKRLHPW